MKARDGARCIGACLVVGGAAVASRAGADWEAIPDVRVEAETNDNPALQTGAPQRLDGTSRLLADVLLTVQRTEPRGELTFEPRVRGDAYADEAARPLESTDVFLRSSGRHRGRTVQVGYDADAARERILGLEFLETLPTEPVADDPTAVATSEIGVNERRTRFGVLPYVEIALSPRGALRFDGRVVDIDYAHNAPDRTDFLERMLGGEYRRRLGDERGRFGVRLFATGYDASGNDNATDTSGVELSYEREVTELWSWHVSAGAQRSNFAFDSGGQRVVGTDDTPLLGLRVDKRGERSGMRAELARQMSPDSMGFVAPRDELRVAWQRLLSARVNGRMVIRAIDAEGTPAVANSDRQYGRVELDVEWQFRPAWWFTAGYAYDATSSSAGIAVPLADDGSADSNSLTLGVRYRGRSAQSRALR